MLKLLIILLIRILCIGNSFSWDAVEQELVPLCDEEGIEIEVHNLYYGGCSLQQHAEFLIRDSAVYSHRVCTNLSPSPLESGGERFRLVKDTISLRQALKDGEYNFISLQQASHDSGIRSSYEPWLSLLIDTVRAYQPNAQLCWMQTWAYSQDAKHPAFPRYHNNQQEMWDSIQSCTQYVRQIVNNKLTPVRNDNSQFSTPNSQFSTPNSQFSIPNSQFSTPNSQLSKFDLSNNRSRLCRDKNSQFSTLNSQLSIPNSQFSTLNSQLIVIPCGLAIQNARSSALGDTMCRDGYHLNYTYGRYTASCVWFEFITGKDVRCNHYKNPQMTNKQRRLAQKSAHDANISSQRKQ